MITVNNLSFAFTDTPVLNHINMTAESGKITAIVGTNGAGKTTLLKAICGLIKTDGEVLADGVAIKDSGKDFISYLEQDNNSRAALTVFEVILLGRMKSLGFRVGDDDIKAVSDIMDFMNISQYADRNIYELSGGQRQLVFIAQALIKEPSILALDEPTSALDLHRQFRLMELLKELTVKNGYTTIMTLHHLDMALGFADSVVVIDNNTVYAQGSPEEIFTEDMMKAIYHINARIYCDEFGKRHIIPINGI